MGAKMRHVKIYEEYSDDELRDLIGDLEKAGHKHELKFGKDYGFGMKMRTDERPTGKSTLFFTPEAVEFLKEKGFFNLEKRFAGFDYLVKTEFSPVTKGQWGIRSISAGVKRHMKSDSGSPYYLTFSHKDMEFPETYHNKKFRTPTLIVGLNKILTSIKNLVK
jgi:hypothetical protein